MTSAVGIEAISAYVGSASIGVEALFRGRGLRLDRLQNLEMAERSVGLPFEDTVTNAVNAARPIVDALGGRAERIELLVVATESGVDLSKSVTSYVHEHLGLSRNCRILEVKQACYSATGILQLAVGYFASGLSPGSKALVIGSDVALADARSAYAEPSTGFGAVALLVGDRPDVLTIDIGAYGLYSYETLDSARPTPEMDIADVDRSLFAYLDGLTSTFAHYREAVPEADVMTTFQRLCFHTPFAGLVRAAHRKLVREAGHADADRVLRDFETRVEPSLRYSRRTGNMCAGSLYLALAGLADEDLGQPATRAGLFSYGSGCAAEFFSGILGCRGARGALDLPDIGQQLDARTLLDFETYCELLAENQKAIVPTEERTVAISNYTDLLPSSRPDRLALTGIKGFHRYYEWI